MKFLNKVASVLLGGSLLFLSSPAKASTDGHEELWDSLQDVGITIVVNNSDHCDGDYNGAYLPLKRTLIVCQDNASSLTTSQVAWTNNDLDTLRHEAHHVLQDCMRGELGDGYARPFFDDFDEYTDFVEESLNERQIEMIIKSYRENGATDELIFLELEAFAVAKDISPELIAEAIDGLCRV